jgi:hypothetical protein
VTQHPAFQAYPSNAQFAKGGSWETAWSFNQADAPSRDTLAAYLQDAREIAFEVFFTEAFFGVRFEGTAMEVLEFAEHCTESFSQSNGGASLFAALEAARRWPPLGGEILFSEVGAVNAWKSVGGQRLPRPVHAIENFDALWADLSETPLARDTEHRKALEFAYGVPAAHWFALPVSESLTSNLLSQGALKNALAAAAQIAPIGT